MHAFISSLTLSPLLLCLQATTGVASPRPSHSIVYRNALPAIKAATTQTCSIYGSNTLNCYEGPGSSYTAKATVKGGHFYQCSCQRAGGNVNGDLNWDFIPEASLPGGGCYVNQYYTTAPCANSTLPQC